MVNCGLEHWVVADEVYQNPTELELTTTETRLLTIFYHSLSFATRQMRYSYILENYDEEWRDTWERQIRYENLPAGEYTFKVMAINRDLVTSESPAILELRVVPDPRDVRVNELESDLITKNQQLAFLQREVGEKYQFEEIIGDSKPIEFVRAQMEQVIDSDLDVLITSETGTGKELVARGIHYNSSRKDGLLLPYNCATARALVSSPVETTRPMIFSLENLPLATGQKDMLPFLGHKCCSRYCSLLIH